MDEKRGEIVDAFVHPELGPIAFIYGNEKMGLRHIESKHGQQVLSSVPEVLRNGRLLSDTENLPRAYIITADDPSRVAVIRLDWNGEAKAWLVTSFDDEQGSVVARQMRTSNVPPASAPTRIPDATGQKKYTTSASTKEESTSKSVSPVRARELTPQEWEHAGEVLRGKPVADVNLGIIQARGGEKASDAAKRWLAENPQDDLARAGLGRIIFNAGSIKNTIMHGFSPLKFNALAAVPDVVRKGVILDRSLDASGKDLLNHVIGAPVVIDGRRHIMFVRLRSELQQPANSPRFYVHEVVLENVLEETGSSPSRLTQTPSIDDLDGQRAREHRATTPLNNLPDVAEDSNKEESSRDQVRFRPARMSAGRVAGTTTPSENITNSRGTGNKGNIDSYIDLARRALSSAPARQSRTARAALLSGDLSGIVRTLTDSGQLRFESRVPVGAPIGVSAWTDPDGTIHMLDSVPAAEAALLSLDRDGCTGQHAGSACPRS